ncbi:uncharacterized protein PHACADRAFT_184096 [Phanerochaete carnosa HHB-10118-sp]|uniref:Kinesin motor domain-containing protein n=1 Tax=Phanerochaete carnosa (strain HHB-10118-sp) TaxID=650164 RepID=K5W8K9_PHACS|nr:uncharacterized protein PHACADRAFT_184096 [Phanerochaete carnosa HHB-10118-sp]EKM55284.1 hypothetical protein PHACADRAFT_184096 [Phanerochaete carnosa HHB-10118-sp]
MAPTTTTTSNGATTSVQVALRIRPPTNQDSTSIPARFQRSVINAISPTSVAVDATSSALSSVGSSAAAATPASSASSAKKQVFTFDQVHPPPTTQYQLFTSTAQPLTSRFIEGFNCTILAYGQTSSGKTFTMTGIDLDLDPTDPDNGMGIIPRAVASIYQQCRELKDERGSAWSYSIKGSFIELYNEDLIDLLGFDESGGKASNVQIREDKQGHIIWEGLREVSVKNSNEVMGLLRKGTSFRRTNETDMNAQSSRSHAIFSLILTQRKFVGSGPPPRSSSPLPPGANRPPSRLARPSSTTYTSASGNRVSSPTFGRPATPSFASAMGRGGSSIRPPSSMGMLSPPDGGRRHSLSPGAPQTNGDGDGEWVTIISKFHFVDLAGSERLKRTAAAGERVKEGISINSGLLALGNVISALGDPAKAKTHTASYIPYRDSKLTRLLQDSLGGNAHTLMIACVSPAEWNANETVNTLKYANRARNIKNRVTLNEKEEGWDDVEWLQGMVARLRKELKVLKDGGAVAPASSAGVEPETSSVAVQKAYSQMAELRFSYEDLRAKYVDRTEELTRLRRDLAEKQRASGGAVGGTAKYEEIVGPVIEEYEKTISAMEAELSLNRAALRHTNDLVDEKEAELAQLAERHVTTEMYVEELRSRVAKLSEREASTEAYIRDLEEKVKLFNEDSMTTSGSMSDLKRELTKVRDAESHSVQYIAELEARLAKSDESVIALQQTVEQLEEECEARREDVKILQSRLEQLQRDGQGWRTDLEEREKKIQRMEAELKEREESLKAMAENRERLGVIVSDVSEARKNLEVASITSDTSSVHGSENLLEEQLVALQQTHTATLADLSSVSAKYRDALREIADLAAQLQEAKVNASIPPTPLSESPERPTEVSSPRRRMTRGMSKDGLDGPLAGTGRRLHYRQAVSTESLHARSMSQSLSLSQELSSARSRKTSTSSHGTSSSLSLSPGSKPSLSLHVGPNERSVQSLEQEIMRLQEVLKEREAEISALEQSLKEKDRATTSSQTFSPDSPTTPIQTGSSAMVHLSPKTRSQFEELHNSISHTEGNPVPDADESLERLNELMRSMAQKESSHREIVDGLNAELNQLRRQHDELTVLSRDQVVQHTSQALNMSNEIEGLRYKHEEDLTKLDDVQQHEAELLEALERAQADHASAVEKLKADHEEALRVKEAEVDGILAKLKDEHDAGVQDLCSQLVSASAALEKARQDHEATFGRLQADHEEELRRQNDDVNKTLERMRVEHEAEVAAALEKARSEHNEAFSKLRAEHDQMLQKRSEEHQIAVEETQREYEDAVSKLISDHQQSLKNKEEESSATLQRTEEEYYEALTKLRIDHSQALEKQAAEHATTLERLKDEHVRELRMAEIAREGSLTQSQSAQESALRELQEAHASAVVNKESQFAEDLQKLRDEHVQILATKDEQHRASVQRVKAEHAATLHDKESAHNETIEKLTIDHAKALATKDSQHQTKLEQLAAEHSAQLKKLQEDSEANVAQLTAELEKVRNEKSSIEISRKDTEQILQQSRQQQAVMLQEAERGHQEEVIRLKAAHDSALEDVELRQQEERYSLAQVHVEELAHLKAEHQTAVGEAQSELIAAQEQHRKDLEEARAQTERLLQEEKARLTSSLSDLEGKQAEELSTLRKDHDVLVEEKVELSQSLSELAAKHQAELTALREERDALTAEKARLSASVADVGTRHAAQYTVLQQEHGLLLEEFESHKAAAQEAYAAHEDSRLEHEAALQKKSSEVASLHQQLSSANSLRDALSSELDKLREELEETRNRSSELAREASKRQSLAEELERHRSALAEMQENLQKTKDEMDTLQAEKHKQDAALRDLQAQLHTRSPSPPQRVGSAAGRANGIPAPKLPPLTPLPSLPGGTPQTPTLRSHEAQMSSTSSAMSISSRSIESVDAPLTPATSVAPSVTSPAMSQPDPKLVQQVQGQAKLLEEQEVMIKTLNKQLTHCESDLQAHIDMVATLETSLAEAEKNLRKARMQATEISRDRDNLNTQVVSLRQELAESKNEVANVRRSVVEEKQSLEIRLDEERRAKERARAQLDGRMDELQRRKSKFACL